MKNDKKVFILIEAVLAVIVLVIALSLLREKTEKDIDKISVIVENSDDNQWSAFIYGLKMAAEDNGDEVFVVSTGAALTVEEQKSLVEGEVKNGADALIVQPVVGEDTEKMLKRMSSKIPIMLVERTASEDRDASLLPVTEPDNYAMGTALAEELLKDYNGNLTDKTLGIFSEAENSEAVMNRRKGFEDGIKDTGAKVSWIVSKSVTGEEEIPLGYHSQVDIVVALDNHSLTTAGEYSASNNLHGALVYGIGNSTEAVYYLDTGFAECLVVPDEFNVGYQSMTEIAKRIGNPLHRISDNMVSYMVIRRDTLFSKENQEVLFTMSQ